MTMDIELAIPATIYTEQKDVEAKGTV
jgi:hypothetical protein